MSKKKNYRKLHGQAALIKRIEQNGITMEDLRKVEERALAKGYMEAATPTYKICYAASLLALNKHFGFGKNRGIKFIRAMDEEVINTLSSMEAVDEVFERMGIELDLSAFDIAAEKGFQGYEM